MNNIKAISFDLDDTLWACAPVIHKAEDAMLTFMQTHCEPIRQQYDMNRFVEKKSDFMKNNQHLLGDVTRMRLALLEDLIGDSHSHLIEDAFRVFSKVRSEVDFYADALRGLEVLSQHYPLAALTNGNANLSIIGIEHYFAEIHYASLECPAKPDKHMFERTCEGLNIQADQLLHVGDNPDTDVDGARRAGAKTVWIKRFDMTWPGALPRADFEVTTLDELIGLLPISS